MPITSSAKKALRQNVKRKAQNTMRKDAYKSAVKAFHKFLSAKKMEEAKTALAKTMKALDKAAKTNAIKKNTASRLKSRLAKALGKAGK